MTDKELWKKILANNESCCLCEHGDTSNFNVGSRRMFVRCKLHPTFKMCVAECELRAKICLQFEWGGT